MSAFMVSNETIETIINGVFWSGESNWMGCLIEAGYFDEANFIRLGNELLAMNRDAVNQRYKENEEAPKFKWSQKLPLRTNFQVLKAMECLKYQCSEGNVMETELYKLLEKMIYAQMYEIVHGLEGYEKAKWGA